MYGSVVWKIGTSFSEKKNCYHLLQRKRIYFLFLCTMNVEVIQYVEHNYRARWHLIPETVIDGHTMIGKGKQGGG
jgi:hypothetical protein